MSTPAAHTDPLEHQGAHLGAEPELREIGTDAILLPYQQAWVADESQVKIIEKSRRIGISWAEASDAALHAASASGSDVFYLAYNQDMTRTFIEDCAWWARWYDQAASAIREDVFQDDSGKDIQVFRIDFASGHSIQALSSKPRNLRSKQGRVIFDEFAFHDDPDGLLKAAMALLIWGGQVRVISTHNGIDNAFNRLIEDCRKGRRPFSVHRVEFQEAVEQGLYKRICLVQGNDWSPEAERQWMEETYDFYGEDAREELDVIPSKSGGRYLSRLIVEQCMTGDAPVLRLSLQNEFAQLPEAVRQTQVEEWLEDNVQPVLEGLNPHLKSSYGMDFARSGDLSVLLPLQEEPSLARRAAFALEMRNVPFEQQRQVLFYVVDRLPRFTFGAHDATGNGAYLAEVAAQKYGFGRIEQVKLNQPWYLEHFPKYKAALEDRNILLPQDSDLLDDHGDVERRRGVPMVDPGKKRRGTDGGQRHGDGAIAGVLAWYASGQGGAPIEYEHIPGTERAGTDAWGDLVQGSSRIEEDDAFGAIAPEHDFRGFG